MHLWTPKDILDFLRRNTGVYSRALVTAGFQLMLVL